MSSSPIFTNGLILGRTRIAAANTARDGSGTINTLKRSDNSTDFIGACKFFSVTADSSTDKITCNSHGLASGDYVYFASGTAPTGTSLNTLYYVLVTGTNDFQLINTSTFAVIDLTSNGSNLILVIGRGSRIDKITFTSAQATPGASSAMVLRIFISDITGSNWRIYKEQAQVTVTASNTAVGATYEFSFPTGFYIPAGCKIGFTISVYGSAVDQFDVIVNGGDY